MKKFALFTCDAEFTPPWYCGTWENQDRTTFQSGIRNIEKILSKFDIHGTFYCVGVLVKEYSELVRGLAKKHLIGSHGYYHENYGGPLLFHHYTPEPPISIKDKDKKHDLLHKCVEIHKEVLGYEPEVFVAPCNSIDYDLLSILEELNFRVDSSFYNYSLGLPTQLFKLVSFDIYELPLSVIRFGEYGYKNVLQALALDYTKISEILGDEIIYITCHPFEFIDIKVPHPEHVLTVGKVKVKTLERLIQDLLHEGYEFVDPLQLLEKTHGKGG